jgi:hypothetical protein
MHCTRVTAWRPWWTALALIAALSFSACTSDDPPATTTAAAAACSGPQFTAEDFARTPAPAMGSAAPATPTIGKAVAEFALPDVQPISCGYKAHYGLKPFLGKVTVVALLASW